MKFHLRLFGWHIYIADYRMKKRNYRPGFEPKRWTKVHLMQKVLKAAGGKCEACGRAIGPREMQIHHIVPLSMGGRAYDINNLQCLCAECHKAIHCNPLVYADQIRAKLKENRA